MRKLILMDVACVGMTIGGIGGFVYGGSRASKKHLSFSEALGMGVSYSFVGAVIGPVAVPVAMACLPVIAPYVVIRDMLEK